MATEEQTIPAGLAGLGGEGQLASTAKPDGEAPPDETTPEYATKAEMQSLTEAIQALQAQIAGKVTVEPTEEAEIDRLYNQLIGESPPKSEGTEADPTQQRLERMEKLLAQQLAMTDSQRRASIRAEINREYGAKYDDWNENEAEIWALAKEPQYCHIKDPNEVYLIWKYQKEGGKGMTQKEQKTAKEAISSAAEEAKAASSEKPGAPAAGKTREPSSLGELLRETYANMPAKPQFR